MKILEKELFNYIFFPESLTQKRIDSIRNSNLYQSEIKLLKSIKDNYNEEVSPLILEIINNRITLRNKTKVDLFKKSDNEFRNQNNLILAADSENPQTRQTISTFEDKNSNYLVKIISDLRSKKIFLFTKTDTEKNFQITLYPSEKKYDFESPNRTIIVEDNEEISSLSVSII